MVSLGHPQSSLASSTYRGERLNGGDGDEEDEEADEEDEDEMNQVIDVESHSEKPSIAPTTASAQDPEFGFDFTRNLFSQWFL